MLRLVAAPGVPAERLEALRTLPIGDGFCGAVFASGQAMSADAERIGCSDAGVFLRALGATAYVGHPLVGNDGRPLGTLSFASTTRQSFGPEDLDLLQTLSRFVALAWQRRRTEAALRESEAFSRSILGGTTDCMVVLDAEGRLRFMNEPGRCQKEIDDLGPVLGRQVVDLWPQESHALVWAAIGHARTGRTARYTAFGPTAKGTPKWWDVTVTPLPGAPGEPPRILSVARDITEAHRIGQELRDSEAFLSSVLDASTDCVKVVERDGTLTFMNANGQCLMELGDFGALRGAEWAALWPEGGQDQVREAVAAALAGREARFEAFCPTAKGTPKWWDVAVAPVRDARGQVARLVSASRDVTERKRAERALAESEAHLRRVLDNLFAFVGVLAPDGTLLDANRAPLEAAGITFDDVRGRPFWECAWWTHDPAEAARVREACARAAAGEVSRFDAVVRMAGDSRMTIDFQIAPLRDAEGRVTHLIPSAVDVTERRAAERALAESETRLRFALEAGRMGIWDWDLTTDRLTWDARQFDLFGLDPAAGVPSGGLALERVHPDDRAALGAAIRDALTSAAGAYSTEFRVVLPDGATRWLGAHGHAVRGPDGGTRRMVGLNFDITQRREAAVRLAESEARLRLTTEGTGIGTWQLDLRTGQGRNSPEAAALLGIARLEETAESWVEAIHPEDRASTVDAWRRALDEGAPYDVMFRGAVPAPDGGERWLTSRAWIERDAAGQPLRGLGVLIDITAQKRAEAALRRSEARFRAAVAAVSGIIWTNNARGEMEGEQPGWAALTGQGRAEYQGHGWAKAVHPEDAGPTLDAWHEAVSERQPFVSEHRVRTKDRAWRRFAIRAIPVLHGGRIHEWVGVHTDVTEQREAEAVLARSKQELEHLVEARTAELRASEARLAEAAKMEALGRLAGGIAHDFNNVLQAVQGGVTLAAKRMRTDPDAAQRFLDLASDSAERGAAVTGRLLSFARRGELAARPVEPAPMLRGLAAMLKHTLGPAVTLAVEAGDGTPELFADAGQLEAVLVNLANNARDALPGGRGTITLSAGQGAAAPRHLPTGDYIRLSVSDTGEGMSPEVLRRVAEPFFTTKPKGKGTGLGLAMARGFAEQSGGALTIESASGEGTTVSLWLPRALGGDEGRGMGAATGGAAPPQPTPGTSVLVVDDEPGVRATLAAALADHGHATAEAEDAAAALARLDAGLPVDVLVTDLAMPGGMDGLSLIKEARRRRPRLPAVLVTGHVGDATRGAIETATGEGPFALLRKPASAAAVKVQIAILLRSASEAVRAAE